MVEEGEQVRAELAVSLSQALAVAVGGRQRHDGVERAFEAPAVFAPGAWGQVAAPPGEHNGAQQQCLHARGEHGVAGLDGVGAVTELMGQADLPVLGMALLRAVEVRHPERRPMPVQHSRPPRRRPGCGGSTWITTSSFWKTQFQQVRPSMRTLVSSEHTTRARRSRARMLATSASNMQLAPAECRVERALADGQAEQLQQQPAQPLVADRVHEAQIHRQTPRCPR